MPGDSSIIAYFGGDTSNLREATQEATIMVKGFGGEASRAIREIGEGFGAAVAVMAVIKAVKELSTSAMDTADKARLAGQALSEQDHAWLALEDVIGDAKQTVVSYATEMLALPLEAGVAIGKMIGNLQGFSNAEQDVFQKISDDAIGNIAAIQAAHDKFVAELPAKQVAAYDALAKAGKAYEESQVTGQDRVNELTSEQGQIAAQIVQTTQVLNSQEAAGVDTAATKLILTQQQAALLQTTAELQKAQVQAATEQVQTMESDFNVMKESLSIEDQVTALKNEELNLVKQASAITDNDAQKRVLLNAADKLSQQIAADTLTIRKATELSEEDQLAMFEHETDSLQGMNTLSNQQYDILVQQKAIKEAQYQIDQEIEAGYAQGTKDQQDELAVHIQKLALMKEELATTQAQVTADQQEVNILSAAKQAAAAGGMKNGVNQSGMEITLGPDGQPILISGDPDKGDAVYAADQEDGSFGPGMPGTENPQYVGTDPSFGNNTLQQQDSIRNNQQYLTQQIQSLTQQREQLLMAGDPNSIAKASQIANEISQLQSRYNSVGGSIQNQPSYSSAVGTGGGAGSAAADDTGAKSLSALTKISTSLDKLTGGLG